MLRRRLATLVGVASVGLSFGCRPDTVHLDFEPVVGATYRYRYEIEATITRAVEGEDPRTTELDVTVEATQTVLELTDDGAILDVTLTSSASPSPATATVVVDRAGSLQAIEQLDGLPVDAGLPSTDAVLAAAATRTPDRALTIGDRWAIHEGTINGTGRLDRLRSLDGDDVAVVEIALVEVLNATEQTGGSEVVLDGDLDTSATTAFDLADGSVRESRTTSRGTVQVLVAPPVGVVAPAVDAVVTYDLRVTTTRTG